jgi:hypothetical protein
LIAKFVSGWSNRRIFVSAIALCAALALTLFFAGVGKDRSGTRPQLLIMSSIALQWGDATISDIASGEAQPSPLFEKLSETHKPVLIDDFQKIGAPGKAPLLLIQPRALAPRELVQLDGWVRNGGFVLVFADPALDWPSDLPLGDQRRPLFTSMLTPLFRHWGLELALPVDDEPAGQAMAGGHKIAVKSAGIWRPSAHKKPAANCTIRDDELIAYCRVGKGQALLVADADMLHDALWTDGLVSDGTMVWLAAILGESAKGRVLDGKFWENGES